ncbi:MAG: hypothetical protein KDK71_09020 [Chlamydiia bacterium]|nr:hypothetical protein [Chlamydiia bacterium]
MAQAQEQTISDTNPLIAIMQASASLQQAQLTNEQVNANTTELQATKLNDVYSNANDDLQQIIDKLNSKSSTNEINEITAQYNLASSKYSNYENVLSSNVQTQETQTQGIAQDQKMTVEFAMDANGVESYLGNLLSSSMG